MTAQLELFAPEAPAWSRKTHWALLGYDGPAPGRYCDIDQCFVELDGGGSIYAYMEQCRLIERRPDGLWSAVIEMGNVHGEKWHKDGTRVLLSEDDVWAPMKVCAENRNDTHSRLV